MHKNWNELKHVLVHVTFHVIYFRRDQLKGYFGTLGIYTILCWSSDAPPPSVLQNFKFLASSIVQASYVIIYQMWCCQCVSSQLDTHIAEVQVGGSVSVNALEFWRARGPSGLARLAKNLICAPASQAYVECICFVCGLLYSGRRSSMFRSLEMRVCLKLSQIKCWKKPLLRSNRLSETWC